MTGSNIQLLTDVAQFTGFFAGVLGLCIATYLQVIMARPCPAKWVVFFLLFGFGLASANVEAAIEAPVWTAIMGNLVIVLAEVLLGWEVVKQVRRDTEPTECTETPFGYVHE